jgi:hypothetical protein
MLLLGDDDWRAGLLHLDVFIGRLGYPDGLFGDVQTVFLSLRYRPTLQ